MTLPRFGQNIVQQPPPNPGDDIPICFGDGDEFCWVWDTTDPNAHLLMGGLPAGGAVNVPVVAIGIGIVGVNLGLFDGIVDANYAVVDDDNDGAVMVGYIEEDAPAIQILGASSGLLIALLAGAPGGADGDSVHVWAGDAVAVAAADARFVVESDGRTVLQLLAPNENSSDIFFGSPDSAFRGFISYQGSADALPDTLTFGTASNPRLRLGATTLDFLQDTTISAVGTIILDPSSAIVDLNGNNIIDVATVAGRVGNALNLSGNRLTSDATAQRVIIQTLDTVGNARIDVAHAEPTATETTPFWAQRADITLPIAAALDADFLTFRWTPADDVVTVFVNDGGVIRSVAIGTVI